MRYAAARGAGTAWQFLRDGFRLSGWHRFARRRNSAHRAGEVRQRIHGVDQPCPTSLRFEAIRLTNCLALAGVEPKRAAQLVRRYGTLDGVLEAGLFKTQAEMLRLYRLIATMDASAPLPSLADQQPTWSSASTFARDWGLNQLADRLQGMA